jgi:hypothetical protein
LFGSFGRHQDSKVSGLKNKQTAQGDGAARNPDVESGFSKDLKNSDFSIAQQ